MIGEEGPGVDRHRPSLGEGRQTADEVGPIPLIPEEDTAFDPPRHNMVEDAGGVEAWATRHGGRLRPRLHAVKQYPR